MDSKAVLYSPGNNDEMMTPREAVVPLLKYLKIFTENGIDYDRTRGTYTRGLSWRPTIWCPFDKEESQFVQAFRAAGYPVVFSHIDAEQDFYLYEPQENWDVMISNPPFSGKRHIFSRALSFGRPFALLMSLTWLNDSAPKQLFRDRDLQLLMFDKRIQYSDKKKITFSSAYFCADFLPKQIIMAELPRATK